MDHETQALLTVNLMKKQLAMTTRVVVNALADGSISPMEAMMLTTQGLQLAGTLMAVLQGMSIEQASAVLHVLEHGEFVLAPAAHREHQ